MKTRNVALLLVALVFNVIQDSVQSEEVENPKEMSEIERLEHLIRIEEENAKRMVRLKQIREMNNFNFMMSPTGNVEIIDLSIPLVDYAPSFTDLTEGIDFNLYTISNPRWSQKLRYADKSDLTRSSFNASKPTRFVIHGWQSSRDSEFCVMVRDAYLAVRDYNVIVVDWWTFAKLDYVSSRSNVLAVGRLVGKMIDFLEEMGADLKDLTIVGHSLGGHIAGIAARSANHDVDSVVGLDPAGPLFYMVDTITRLRPSDAKYVQVIHTSAGRMGYDGNLGHADFWVNGGYTQPGCGMDVFSVCAHLRAYKYFAESLSDNEFRSRSCTNLLMYETGACSFEHLAKMGGCELDKTAVGTYYLITNSERKFARS